ncbi:MAG: LamG domain-containing protein [Verrucomicrobiales bacterium]|nr:LamG domain-containing protein [Verrucomicrobiales bacterium]
MMHIHPLRGVLPLLAAATVVGSLSPSMVARADYGAAVQADDPVAYYRFVDLTFRTNIAYNMGTAGGAANATNFNVYPTAGALAGTANPAGYHDGAGARNVVPFNPALNPPATESFSIEAWIQPSVEVTDSPGPAPLMNRYSYSGANRQGWVFFQRSPETGWNFRTYTGEGSSTGVNITGQATTPDAGKAGTWNHLVAVWDGPASTATLFVNGEKVAEGSGGYQANTDTHDPAEAVRGPAGLSIGSYNNTEPGSNPFHGAIDEVALYGVKLSEAQILNHYSNGTNALRTREYGALILSERPVEYLRFDEPSADLDVAVNMGSAGPAGNGQNAFGVRHPVPGPVNDPSDTATSYQSKNGGGGGVQTLVPWNAEINPPAEEPFTIEAWIQPHVEVTDSPGPAPLMNRYSYSGANRQGWVFFQRSPETGWNFRTYTGEGSSTGINITGQATTPDAGKAGTWNHLVAVWDGASTTATLYVNGEKVAEGSGGYAANTDDHDPAEAVRGPAGLSIGSYNNTEPGANPFNGAVADVAVYRAALTADQIAAHYAAGTNTQRTVGYAAVVLADKPVEFLRLNDPAYSPVSNIGFSTGIRANGSLVFANYGQAGPRPTAFRGFEAANYAIALDGTNSYVNLNHPAELNFSGQIALEAWIQPAAAQGTPAYIIGHGPTLDDSAGVGLRILDGTKYAVGTFDGTDHDAVADIPAADLSGSAWVHLVGTYDGTRWVLYRNGAAIANQTSTVGAVAIAADWAIGQRGSGKGFAFAGSVDEVAIYSKALSADRVKAHYAAAIGSGTVTPSLAISRNGAQITITFSGGALEEAAAVTGPFAAVPGGANSPYQPSTTVAAKFYRVRQ